MQYPSLILVLLSLLQGGFYAKPLPLMSEQPDPTNSQPLEVTRVAKTLGSIHPIDFKLSDYQWQHRLVLVFTPSNHTSDYQQQVKLWQADPAGIRDRDLLWVEVLGTEDSRVDGQPITGASAERLRQQFGITGSEFAVVLIGKDGTEKRRSHTPIDLANLFRVIDTMPMRQQEMQNQS